MIKYKVTSFENDENEPLLISNENEENNKYNDFVSEHDNHYSRTELEISSERVRSESGERNLKDFAQLNNCQAIIHIIKASIGTGVLAIPSALRYSGLLLGSFAIIILSIVSIYAMRLLLLVVANIRITTTKYIPDLDYENTVKLCFEKSNERFRKYSWLRHVLYGSLALTQIGFLSSYHIFVAENTKVLLENYINQDAYKLPLWGYQAIFFFFLSPLLFIKTLDKLSYFTQFANLMMITSLMISLVYCLQDPLPIQNLPLIKINDATLLFFGIIIFSFESINLINPVECDLKKKKNILDSCGVLNIATSIVLVSFLIIGICGYWKFGDNITSSLILSIPMVPWYYMLCKPFYIISIIISYSLQGYVMFNIIWKKIEPKFKNERFRCYGAFGLRLGIVLTTTLLSIAIPHFDLFISLVGAFSGASITLIFPAICNSVMVFSNQDAKHWKIQLFINAIIFSLGIMGCVFGTYSSIINIVRALKR